MKKKSDTYILYAMVVLVIGILIYSLSGFFPANENTLQVSDLPGDVFKPIMTGSTAQGDVEIELIPNEVTDGKLDVQILANTHSVDLSSFDLAQITTLEYNGNIINPTSASDLDGHHASGKLTFDIREQINAFTITISGIPNIEKRVFEWR